MVQRLFYAHSLDGRPKTEWHQLEEHLGETTKRAVGFGEMFGSADWARLAGLWHDLGKYLPEFQKKLEPDGPKNQHVDHSVVGALLAQSFGLDRTLPLAFAVSGHHGGLPNLRSSEFGLTPLLERLHDHANSLERAAGNAPALFMDAAVPSLPEFLRPTVEVSAFEQRRQMEFWIRFLFSALVDADFLDTEAFFKPGMRSLALGVSGDVAALRKRLDDAADALSAKAAAKLVTSVNRLRAEVLECCREKAKLPPGIFSLTVPTGGGKTLSGMAFALRHAETHGLKRVIVVIPYTSIIEQNAKKYREALGDNVIEHHSNLAPTTETDLDPTMETERNRLASENWDAPVVVTTTVQFFESLFSNKPSRCRKLHNIARSVIILDEVQSLPPGFLSPILEAMRELVAHYGCSIVLSTATQPALVKRPAFRDGLDNVREIAPDPGDLFRRLSRVDVAWPELDSPAIAWPELAAELKCHRQMLAVVHRRDDARDLAKLLPPENLFHLSALMCPKHRLDVLAAVNKQLDSEQPCRLVSTQLVEAGVDIDFPVVYRSLGGLDSVVQAAGRCNREGKRDKGKVVVFRAPTQPPRGTPKMGLETMESLLRQYHGQVDITDPAIFEEYFRMLYSKLDLDIRRIQPERQELNFASTAEKFRIIEDGFSEAIVVPYANSAERVAAVRKELNRDTARALQPFLVNVYPDLLSQMQAAGALETIGENENIRVLMPDFHKRYDMTFGLVWNDGIGAGIV